MFSVLLAEDDKNIAKLIASYLKNNDFNVVVAENGEEAVNAFSQTYFDIIISDIMMPILDGNELVKYVRACNEDIPIIIITAKDSLLDKRNSYMIGVDDYIVKPIDLEELLLKMYAMLRRARAIKDKVLKIDDVCLDYRNYTLKTSNATIELPKKEFLLLFKLLSTPNRIFTRTEIMDEIWGYDNDSEDRTIDVHIKRIREKLEGITVFNIVTVRGIGYKAVIS